MELINSAPSAHWRRVAAPLRQAGWQVYTPSLTGLADRAHLLTREVNLETHVHDITELIAAEEFDKVILCGHSAAGAVISVAADRLPDRIAGLCYLDASMPLDGQSLLDFIGDSQGVATVFREQA